MITTNLNLLNDEQVSERQYTKSEVNSKFIPMTDMVTYLYEFFKSNHS